MKTLDINALTWFDKVNGNSYFACRIIINYGMNGQVEKENTFSPSNYYKETNIVLPFQYGYGNQFEYETIKELKNQGFLPENFNGYLREYCKENNIILRINHRKNCLKRELKNV